MAEYRLLFLITNPKLTDKAIEVFRAENVPTHCQLRAQGTASSEVMEILGLGSIEKTVMMSMLPGSLAGEMLPKLRKKLYLGYANSGVAFTIPITGGNSWVRLMEALHPMELLRSKESMPPLEAGISQEAMQAGRSMSFSEALQTDASSSERKGMKMSENEFALVVAVVNQGCSEEVMTTAKSAGATGGTVFHSRQNGSEESMKFFGISVQQEREVVLILARKDVRLPIMKAIGEKHGIKSEAHGMVISLPVDGIAGIE